MLTVKPRPLEPQRIYEDDEQEEGTLYETLTDAAGWIRGMSLSLSAEGALNEGLQAALRDCVLKGDIPQAILDEHEESIVGALHAEEGIDEVTPPVSKEQKIKFRLQIESESGASLKHDTFEDPPF